MKYDEKHFVELSHPILAGRENFLYEPKALGEFGEPDPGHWYIECNVRLCSHVGTHIEVPFHHSQFGADCMDWPLERLIGEAVVIDATGLEPYSPITLDIVKKAEGRIRPGDFILLHTGYDRFFRTENWLPYPYIAPDALDYLLSFSPKAIGTDASGVEIPDSSFHEVYGEPNHTKCFSGNAAIIESMTNLGAIAEERVTLFVLALRMEGMDASPVRIVALRE